LSLWIGVFGKTLAKKGVLTPDEVIEELEELRSRIDPKNSHSAALVAEVNNMIATVKRW
jgi:hypothetical protein